MRSMSTAARRAARSRCSCAASRIGSTAAGAARCSASGRARPSAAAPPTTPSSCSSPKRSSTSRLSGLAEDPRPPGHRRRRAKAPRARRGDRAARRRTSARIARAGPRWRGERRARRGRRGCRSDRRVGRRAHRRLGGDERVLGLQALLEHGSVDLRTAASELFDEPDAAERLVDLIDLGVLARHREDDAPLIPARYHFFLRALEGAFLCLHPEHPSNRPSLLLSRHRWCPVCAAEGREAVMVELASCRRCGAEYAIGKLADGDPPRRLEHAAPMAERPTATPAR